MSVVKLHAAGVGGSEDGSVGTSDEWRRLVHPGGIVRKKTPASF
jgi:hypothetical protein